MRVMSFRFAVPATLLVLLVLGRGAYAQQSIGELYAADAGVKGSVILASTGTTVLSGSTIAAGTRSATLKLERGGSLIVCPGTNLSVTSSQSGRELMLSVNSGNLELNYPIGASADAVLTPDLRLMVPGPGHVHAAVRIGAGGDTCVQSLPGNDSAIVVSETMGDATYQIRPAQSVLFKGGHVTDATASRESCTCPLPPPTQVAEATPSKPIAPVAVASTTSQASHTPLPSSAAGVELPANVAASNLAPVSTPPPSTSAPAKPAAKSQPANMQAEATPPAPPPQEHLTVEVPFVFSADDPSLEVAPLVATLRVSSGPMAQLQPVVLPPPGKSKPASQPTQTAKATTPQKRGFFSKIGAFFATLFH